MNAGIYYDPPPRGSDPYHEIGGPDGHLANLRPFKGNSLSGRWVGDHRYEVVSYRTPIAAYEPPPEGDKGRDLYGRLALDEGNYSVTTSKHQWLVRAWLARAVVGPDVAVGEW